MFCVFKRVRYAQMDKMTLNIHQLRHHVEAPFKGELHNKPKLSGVLISQNYQHFIEDNMIILRKLS